MSNLKDSDWACFIDGDAVHTTTFFGKRIEQIIAFNPDYSLFTCCTNRVCCSYQIAEGVDVISNDQKYHRIFGEKIWNKNKLSILDITNSKTCLSGVLILINKSIWKKVNGFQENKMLGIDRDMHKRVRDIGAKVGLMKGIYVQHWYRGNDVHNIKHLI